MTIIDMVARLGFSVESAPLDQASERLEAIKRRLDFLAAAEIIKGIFALTERFSNFADGLTNAASAAGITTEALQRLQFAGGQAGVGADEISSSLSVLSRKLYEAGQGSDEAIKSFAAVGIPPGQIASFHTTSDALEAIADRISKVSDPIARQAMTLDLLGRGSSKMVAFLGEGADAMRASGAAAQAMGAVVSDDAVAALGEVEDALSGFWQTVKAFSATVASMFAPSIKQAVADFQKFYAANRAILMLNIEAWVGDLMYAFGFLVGVVEGVTGKILRLAAAHPELTRRIGEAILALGGLSLAAGVVNRVLGLFRMLMGGASSDTGGLGSTFGWVSKAGIAFRSSLVILMRVLAAMTATHLPGLSVAFSTLGTIIAATPVAWLVAGLAAVVLAAQAIYAVFFKEGGNWKDTWIYQLFDKAVSAAKWLKDKMGFGDKSAAPPEGAPTDGTAAASSIPPPAPDPGMVQRAAAAARQVAGQVDLGAMASRLTGVAEQRAQPPQMALPPMLAPAPPAPPQMAQNSTINAPITINVPQGTPVRDVADRAKEALAEHMDRVYRETSRNLRVAQAY